MAIKALRSYPKDLTLTVNIDKVDPRTIEEILNQLDPERVEIQFRRDQLYGWEHDLMDEAECPCETCIDFTVIRSFLVRRHGA